MDFGFSEDQELLRDSARKFLDAECPTTFVRKMMEDDSAHATELWKKAAELGWMGILIPEEHGGIGGSFLDLVVVMEEMGRSLMPGPFLATVLLGGTAVLEGGSDGQKAAILPKVAAGELVMTLAQAEKSGRYDAGGIGLPATARGSDFVLSGEKLFVPDAHVADQIVVAARTGSPDAPVEEGITLFLVDAKSPGIEITQLKNRGHDPSPMSRRFPGCCGGWLASSWRGGPGLADSPARPRSNHCRGCVPRWLGPDSRRSIWPSNTPKSGFSLGNP